MQDDILQPRLTVKELMNSAASLKIGAHHTQRMKDKVVSTISTYLFGYIFLMYAFSKVKHGAYSIRLHATFPVYL